MNVLSLVELRLTSEGVIIPANTRLTFNGKDLVLSSINHNTTTSTTGLEPPSPPEAPQLVPEAKVSSLVSDPLKESPLSLNLKPRIVYNYPTIEDAYDCALDQTQVNNFFESHEVEDERFKRCLLAMQRHIQKRDTSMWKKINKEQNGRLGFNLVSNPVEPEVESKPYDPEQDELQSQFEKVEYPESFDHLLDVKAREDYSVSV